MNHSSLPSADEREKQKLPEYMNYNIKHYSPPSETQRYFLSPVSGTSFAPGASSGPIISFNVAGGSPGIHMNTQETSLCFTINNLSGQTLQLDGDASALIQAVDLYYGSSHISSIQDYNVFSSVMSDFQSNGSHPERGTADVDLPAAYGELVTENSLRSRRGMTIANNGSLTVCLPLISQLGTLSSRAIALSQLKDSLRLDIRLAGYNDYGVYGAAGVTAGLTITNPRLWITTIRISGSVENALIDSLPNRTISTACFDVHSFSTSVAQNAGSFSYQLPIKVSSLTSIIVVLRETAQIGAVLRRGLTRSRCNLENYRFRIGSSILPSTSIDCTGSTAAEAKMELMRCLNLLSEANHFSYIDNGMYVKEGANGTALSLADNILGGGFALALNTSSFSMSDILSDGRSTRSEHVTFDGKFLTATQPALTATFFCVTEKCLVIQGGNMTYSD